MKKNILTLIFLFFSQIGFSGMTVTGPMPDEDGVYTPKHEPGVITENSIAGLYRMSDAIYTRKGDTIYTEVKSNYMLNVTEISDNQYIGMFYGKLVYWSTRKNKQVSIDCGKPSIFTFSLNENGEETSRRIVEEGNCKLQKANRNLIIKWKLLNDKLILTKDGGQRCVVEPCGKLDRTVYIQNFDKTN